LIIPLLALKEQLVGTKYVTLLLCEDVKPKLFIIIFQILNWILEKCVGVNNWLNVLFVGKSSMENLSGRGNSGSTMLNVMNVTIAKLSSTFIKAHVRNSQYQKLSIK
jgi:hypothetical protein